MELTINVIDAFTHSIFKGNPAAVIITEHWLNDELMQKIAIENNLSETAFVKIIDQQHYEIRWFSPITEIDFCGHATLAASFVIFANMVESCHNNDKNTEVNTIHFYAKAVGNLVVTAKEDGFFEMCFPNTCPQLIDDVPAALLNGLSIAPSEVLLNNQAYFVVYPNENDVRMVTTNNALLSELAPFDVVVTAQSTAYDFISRYFWPANGGDEDPVTGSIHTGLAPYWAEKLNKNNLIAYQASSRGGVLYCQVIDDKVVISGQAVQYLAGKITV